MHKVIHTCGTLTDNTEHVSSVSRLTSHCVHSTAINRQHINVYTACACNRLRGRSCHYGETLNIGLKFLTTTDLLHMHGFNSFLHVRSRLDCSTCCTAAHTYVSATKYTSVAHLVTIMNLFHRCLVWHHQQRNGNAVTFEPHAHAVTCEEDGSVNFLSSVYLLQAHGFNSVLHVLPTLIAESVAVLWTWLQCVCNGEEGSAHCSTLNDNSEPVSSVCCLTWYCRHWTAVNGHRVNVCTTCTCNQLRGTTQQTMMQKGHMGEHAIRMHGTLQ